MSVPFTLLVSKEVLQSQSVAARRTKVLIDWPGLPRQTPHFAFFYENRTLGPLDQKPNNPSTELGRLHFEGREFQYERGQ